MLKGLILVNLVFLLTVPRLFYCCSSSVISYVAIKDSKSVKIKPTVSNKTALTVCVFRVCCIVPIYDYLTNVDEF